MDHFTVRIYPFMYENRSLLSCSKPDTFRRDTPKIGRNEPCPCGSGRKFKKCCIEKGGDTNEGGDS